MTKEKAAFISELKERASHSPDGAWLSRAAAMLAGSDGDAIQAYKELADAEREAARDNLSEWHQAAAATRVAAAQKALDEALAPVATKGPVKPTVREETEEVTA